MTRRRLFMFIAGSIAVLAACTLGLACLAFMMIYYGTPGHADYSFKVVGDYELFRRCYECRSLYGPGPEDFDTPQHITWAIRIVNEDVVRIGWDKRFIVCCQNTTPHTEEQSLVFWVIDMESRQRQGPLDEEEYPALLMELGASEPIRLHDTPRSSWDVRTFKKDVLDQRSRYP